LESEDFLYEDQAILVLADAGCDSIGATPPQNITESGPAEDGRAGELVR